MDGTPHEAGQITEVIDLIVQYKDHFESATLHVTSIGQTTIILKHNSLMEHNPEIDWHTEDICMIRCPASCRLKIVSEKDWLNCMMANKTTKGPFCAQI